MMKVEDLITLLLAVAADIKLGPGSDPVARFRIAAYKRIAAMLKDKFPPKTVITTTLIDSLTPAEMSPHMKSVVHALIKTHIIRQMLLIPGIGRETASKLYAGGVRSVADLRKKKFANILPKPVIKAIGGLVIGAFDRALIVPHVPKLIGMFSVTVAGSFRRQAPRLGDIDVILLLDPKTLGVVGSKQIGKSTTSIGKKSMAVYLDYLASVLPEVCPISVGDAKSTAHVQLAENVAMQIDIYVSTTKQYPAMLLFLTGSKEFNIHMRGRAKRGIMRGGKRRIYELNQYGLTEVRSGERVEVPVSSEEDIFRALEMEYVPPQSRL